MHEDSSLISLGFDTFGIIANLFEASEVFLKRFESFEKMFQEWSRRYKNPVERYGLFVPSLREVQVTFLICGII